MQFKRRVQGLEKAIRKRRAKRATESRAITFVDIVKVAEGEMEPPPGFEEACRRLMRNSTDDGHDEEA